MTIAEIEQALKAARAQIADIESQYACMIRMAAGHLRQATHHHVGRWSDNGEALASMKRELEQFDARSREWKV